MTLPLLHPGISSLLCITGTPLTDPSQARVRKISILHVKNRRNLPEFSGADTAADPGFAGWVQTLNQTLRGLSGPEPDQHSRNLTFSGILIRFSELPPGFSPDMCRKSLSHHAWGFHFQLVPRAWKVSEAELRVQIIYTRIYLSLPARLGAGEGRPSSVCGQSEPLAQNKGVSSHHFLDL